MINGKSNKKNKAKNQRPAFQSVFFMLKECSDSIVVLEKINLMYKKMLVSSVKEREEFIFDQSTIIVLLGMTRDCFCIRFAYLFDKRKDVHSLKKYYGGPEIDRLENNKTALAIIEARHNKIAHLSKDYVKWPDVDGILSSGIKDSLENIQNGLLSLREN